MNLKTLSILSDLLFQLMYVENSLQLFALSCIYRSDIGDMENDPFVKKLLEIDGIVN